MFVLPVLSDIHDHIVQKHKWTVTDHITNFHSESALQHDNDAF